MSTHLRTIISLRTPPESQVRHTPTALIFSKLALVASLLIASLLLAGPVAAAAYALPSGPQFNTAKRLAPAGLDARYRGSPVSRLYADVQTGVQGVRHSALNFYPMFGSVSAGLWLFDNIGVEVFADVPLADDDNGVFQLEVVDTAGLALRFQSPPTTRFQAYVVLGYVDLTVEQRERLVVESEPRSRLVRQGFSGLRISLGFAWRVPRVPALLGILEYRNYYTEDELQVDGLAFGLRLNLP